MVVFPRKRTHVPFWAAGKNSIILSGLQIKAFVYVKIHGTLKVSILYCIYDITQFLKKEKQKNGYVFIV